MHKKLIWTPCTDLDPIPEITHYVHCKNILNSKEKTQAFLSLSTSYKGYWFFIHKQQSGWLIQLSCYSKFVPKVLNVSWRTHWKFILSLVTAWKPSWTPHPSRIGGGQLWQLHPVPRDSEVPHLGADIASHPPAFNSSAPQQAKQTCRKTWSQTSRDVVMSMTPLGSLQGPADKLQSFSWFVFFSKCYPVAPPSGYSWNRPDSGPVQPRVSHWVLTCVWGGCLFLFYFNMIYCIYPII